MTTIVAERLPPSLCPTSLEWGRSRNDTLQRSPTSRTESLIRRGRPLWTARVTWDKTCCDASLLRYYIDSLQGHRGSLILWDFKCPFPCNKEAAIALEADPALKIVDVNLLTFVVGATPYEFFNGQDLYWVGGTLNTKGMTTVRLRVTPIATAGTILKRGEYIQLRRRLYIVAEDVVSVVGANLITIKLTTPILDSLTAADAVRVVEAGCEMMMMENDWMASRSAGGAFETLTVPFMETAYDYSPDGLSFAA